MGTKTVESSFANAAPNEADEGINAHFRRYRNIKGFSYGFRLCRSPHQALDALAVGLERKKVNWVLDADIRGFFDNVSHEWTVKFLEHRVADRRIIRLIQKAQGGCIGGRPVVGDKEGYAPGGSGLATDRQCIPSLRFRPVGGCLAQKGG